MSNKKQNHIVDSNKMVTAVEWLFKELLNSEPNILEWNKLLEQAKAMEKEQIIDCFMDASQNFSQINTTKKPMNNKIQEWLAKQDRFSLIRTSRNFQRKYI